MDRWRTPLKPQEILGIVGSLAAVFTIVIGAIVLAGVLRTDENAMLALVGGTALAAAALLKPAAFWDHAKAVFLRELIGRRAATLVYLTVGIVLIAFGATGLRRWERHLGECRRLYTEAGTTQERVYALQHPPPVVDKGLLGTAKPLPCYRYRERRPF